MADSEDIGDMELEERLMGLIMSAMATDFLNNPEKIVKALETYQSVFAGYDVKLEKYHKGDSKKIEEITELSENFYLNRGMGLLRPAAEAVKKGSDDYNYVLAAQGVAMLEMAKRKYERFLLKNGI